MKRFIALITLSALILPLILVGITDLTGNYHPVIDNSLPPKIAAETLLILLAAGQFFIVFGHDSQRG
jgi:hypothetical protein